MRSATKRSLLSLAVVSGLVLGLLPATAQTTSLFKGAVDVRNVLAATGNQEFKITVTRTATNPSEAAVNAVLVGVPAAFTLREGRATGWTPTTLSPRRVFFTGGTIPTTCSASNGTPTLTCSATFSIFADVPAASQDVTNRWSAFASSNGGETYVEVPPDGSGAMDSVTRVLQVTSLGITAPAGAVDNSVTAQQTNVDAVCAIQNVGTAALSVTADLTGAASSAATKTIASGATETFGFRFNAFEDVNKNTAQSKTCSGSATNAKSTGFNKSLPLTIQPRATFEYVDESLSPQATAPLATPNFSIQVNKFQAVPPTNTADASPAVTLDPARTDFTIINDKGNIGPTPLGSGTTVGAGEQEAANVQFASLTIPARCTETVTTNCVEDKNYNIRVNLGGTDANGAPLDFRPLPETDDLLRIDAAIPVLSNHRLTAPASRCCRADPAVKNRDTLNISANVTDRDPMGATLPCGTCEVVVSELVQFAAEDGSGGEVGQRIPVSLSIDETGAISGSYSGDYSPLARSVQHLLIVRDTAGNRSDAGTGTPDKTGLIPVDNLAPTIKSAATSPAPTAAGQDLQRTLTLQFSEDVDNFDQPVDGLCPQTDWRTDNNTVLTCARGDGFRSAGLTVADQLPDDTPGTTLQYFPQTPLSFHDRVGNVIAAGSTVPVLDRIPPKAPSFSRVAGKTADSSDGKYYTFESFPPVVLTGARAIVPGYTAELWRENNGKAGLQIAAEPGPDPTTTTDDIAADQKIGQEVVQQGQTSVTVTPTTALSAGTAQTGEQHTLYARSLDTASPANGTDLSTVKSALVVVDKVAPKLASATASANGIEVDFIESVVGRNFATHWEVLGSDGDILGVGSVEGSGKTRTLKMVDARYCPNPGCAVTPASAQYQFFGQASDQYQDKAGNVLPNASKITITLLASAP